MAKRKQKTIINKYDKLVAKALKDYKDKSWNEFAIYLDELQQAMTKELEEAGCIKEIEVESIKTHNENH